ncbi:MAG: protein-glutamate O-methyltransferase CheR [Gammaproteobacteria bacterium]|nr:protein-glutamate O-methyltransferase CheR [Gammaproteobacteria bacterium]
MPSDFLSKKLTDQQGYDDFCQFLVTICGIVLGENKQYLVNSRLDNLMDKHGIESLVELVSHLKKRPGSPIYTAVVDAMTTNETSWFRDSYPYDFLTEQLLPQAVSDNRSLRIWSAASSSGQEPYSISIMIEEFLRHKRRTLNPVNIVATDISHAILNNAKEGVFQKMSLDRGMSLARINHHFELVGQSWKIKNVIKQRITFREFNLLTSYASLGKFDVIFCRNVLIYFSAETKKDIFFRIASALNPKGYLILGGAESTANYTDSFDVVRLKSGLIYQLKE